MLYIFKKIFRHKLISIFFPCIIAGVAAYGISHWVFCHAPITTDANSYVFQAHNFLRGMITRTYPSFPEIFIHKQIILDKHIGWVSRYAPSHPLWLMPGVLFGDPYLMSAIGAAIALLIMAKCASLLGISRPASAFLLLCSPYFLFTFGTLFSHTSGMVASSLMLLAYILWRRTGLIKFAILAGLAWGWLFHNRTFTAFCIAIPFGIDSIIWLWKSRTKKMFFGAIAFALSAAGCVLLLMAYNYVVLGHSLSMTHIFYDKSEALGFGKRHTGGVVIYHDLINGLSYLARNVKLLDKWLFGFHGSLLLFTAFIIIGWHRAWTPLFIGSTLAVWLGYILFWYPGPHETGPGYYFETFPFLYIAGCFGLSRLWSWFNRFPKCRLISATFLACLLAITSVLFMFREGKKLRSRFYERGQMISCLRSAPLNSLVFIDPGPETDYVAFNPVGEESDPLAIRSRDGSNKAVIKHFPNRKPFLLEKKESHFQLSPINIDKPYQFKISGNKMCGQTGSNINHKKIRIVQAGKHKAGWFAYGRKAYVFPGRFEIHYDMEIFNYAGNKPIAAVDVSMNGGRKILAHADIIGKTPPEDIVLKFTSDDFHIVEPRIYYNGNADVALHFIRICEDSNE